MRVARAIVVLVLALAMLTVATSAAAAPGDDDPGGRAPAHEWGISVWGVSYHFDRRIDYNENNWGLGVRFLSTPPWRWLARDEHNRTFVEVDVLRNSYSGLVLPVSVGAEYKLGSVGQRCNVFAMGAFTFAYYRKPTDHSSDVRFGPVPGVSVGCGRLKSNLLIVLSPSRAILAALVGSFTILL